MYHESIVKLYGALKGMVYAGLNEVDIDHFRYGSMLDFYINHPDNLGKHAVEIELHISGYGKVSCYYTVNDAIKFFNNFCSEYSHDGITF